jgi:hypothetical protein
MKAKVQHVLQSLPADDKRKAAHTASENPKYKFSSSSVAGYVINHLPYHAPT